MRPLSLIAATVLALAAAPVAAQTGAGVGTTIQLSLAAEGDAEKRSTPYECDTLDPFTVAYINAAPNFLAIVPVEDQVLVFSAVISASGARYAAGQYVWWTSGPDASLYDLTQGEDADPVATCHEMIMTP